MIGEGSGARGISFAVQRSPLRRFDAVFILAVEIPKKSCPVSSQGSSSFSKSLYPRKEV